MKQIEIVDTTLRDGAQSERISYSVQDKLSITKLLTDIGIDCIEAGAPFSNPKDVEFFNAAKNAGLGHLSAFTRTIRQDEKTYESPAMRSAIDAYTDTVTIFGKASLRQVNDILKVTPEQNLNMIGESIAFLKSHGKRVIFDAEHFFDAFLRNPEYATSVLQTAATHGADVICLCDTNGASLPRDVADITANVCKQLGGIPVGIHCHDDSGLATACTIAAVSAGATHVQGTFIGTGERCGNANLSTIIADLQLKCGYRILSPQNLSKLTPVAREIAEISNIRLSPSMPYVGSNAFTHKAGMHSDGVIKRSSSFEHISPESVGNTRRLLLSEMSGSAVIYEKVKKFFPDIKRNGNEISLILNALKESESLGYQYEGAEASFKLLVCKTLHAYTPSFELISFKCINEQPAIDGASATATVKIRALGKSRLEVAEGEGPVHALDKALRGCLEGFYPLVGNISLLDYKVRVLSSYDATAAKVRVLITSTDGKEVWSTVGVSADIIEASWLALADSFEYKINDAGKSQQQN